MSNGIKAKILRHLSAQSDSWSSTVSKVSKEMNMGSLFVEKAMKDLVECGDVKRCSDGSVPQYQAPGATEGKYSDFNDKRLEGMENPTIRDGISNDDPRKKSIGDSEGV